MDHPANFWKIIPSRHRKSGSFHSLTFIGRHIMSRYADLLTVHSTFKLYNFKEEKNSMVLRENKYIKL